MIDEQRKGVEGFDVRPLGFILIWKLLGFLNHTLNVFLRETAHLVRDRDGFGFAAESMNAVSVMAKKLKVRGLTFPSWAPTS